MSVTLSFGFVSELSQSGVSLGVELSLCSDLGNKLEDSLMENSGTLSPFSPSGCRRGWPRESTVSIPRPEWGQSLRSGRMWLPTEPVRPTWNGEWPFPRLNSCLVGTRIGSWAPYNLNLQTGTRSPSRCPCAISCTLRNLPLRAPTWSSSC